MYADHLVLPWLESVLDALGEPRIFDAHTHVGQHDPSGFSARLDELLEALEPIDGRAAVFPLTEPDGYREANRLCAEAAAQSRGRLTAFVRLTPGPEARRVLEEGLAAGAAASSSTSPATTSPSTTATSTRSSRPLTPSGSR